MFLHFVHVLEGFCWLGEQFHHPQLSSSPLTMTTYDLMQKVAPRAICLSLVWNKNGSITARYRSAALHHPYVQHKHIPSKSEILKSQLFASKGEQLDNLADGWLGDREDGFGAFQPWWRLGASDWLHHTFIFIPLSLSYQIELMAIGDNQEVARPHYRTRQPCLWHLHAWGCPGKCENNEGEVFVCYLSQDQQWKSCINF